jgi:hypothetical protein
MVDDQKLTINKSLLVNAGNIIKAFAKRQNGKEKKEKEINFSPSFPTDL